MTTAQEGLKQDLEGVLKLWHPLGFAAQPYEVIVKFQDAFFAHLRLKDRIVRKNFSLDPEYKKILQGVDLVHTSICMGELRPDKQYYQYLYPALQYCGLEE